MAVVWRGTREELERRLALVPLLATADSPDPTSARNIAKALGVEMLSIIKEAYIEKARGGTDAAGIQWAPLSPRYVAYHRRHKGLTAKRTRAKKTGRERRPLLTAQQDKLWRGVYAGALRSGRDSATAAAIAWGAVKRAGGKTILKEYGGASVEIGRDTGRLLNSISPGSVDNVCNAGPGAVRVGTNVSYAKHFHAKRPMWPDDGGFPLVWTDRLKGILTEALALAVAKLLGA